MSPFWKSSTLQTITALAKLFFILPPQQTDTGCSLTFLQLGHRTIEIAHLAIFNLSMSVIRSLSQKDNILSVQIFPNMNIAFSTSACTSFLFFAVIPFVFKDWNFSRHKIIIGLFITSAHDLPLTSGDLVYSLCLVWYSIWYSTLAARSDYIKSKYL